MASTINASNTGFGGIVQTGDSSGQMQLQTAGTTALTIDTSQNVGIGTTAGITTVTSGLAINNATATNYPGIEFQTAGVTRMYLNANNSASYIVSIGSNPLVTYTNGSERMRIDSSGNLSVGTTASYGRVTGISASNSTRAAGFLSQSSGDLTTEAVVIGKYDNNSTTSQSFVTFTINNSATGSGKINANGANACAFGSYSDSRLKENIEPLPPQLDNILALKPSEFDFKDGSGHQIGFIAQEMQEVYPDSVSADSSEDKILSITGWDKTTARLVKAIQEQQTIINDLKARIETLENKA